MTQDRNNQAFIESEYCILAVAIVTHRGFQIATLEGDAAAQVEYKILIVADTGNIRLTAVRREEIVAIETILLRERLAMSKIHKSVGRLKSKRFERSITIKESYIQRKG